MNRAKPEEISTIEKGFVFRLSGGTVHVTYRVREPASVTLAIEHDGTTSSIVMTAGEAAEVGGELLPPVDTFVRWDEEGRCHLEPIVPTVLPDHGVLVPHDTCSPYRSGGTSPSRPQSAAPSSPPEKELQ